MYKFICTFVLIALDQSTGTLATLPQSGTVQKEPSSSPKATDSSLPLTAGAVGQNSSNTTVLQPKFIPLACNQAFMPLQDDNSTAAVNITECACKAFDTPNGAFCEVESCRQFSSCQNCNQIMPGATPNTTITSNVTVASVECRSNYFFPAPNDTDRRALCTDVEYRSYTCTGPCVGGANCEVCISMDDPALMGPAAGPN